jgi:hypothetical protein
MNPEILFQAEFLHTELISNIAEFRQASNQARWRAIGQKPPARREPQPETTPRSVRARRIGATAAFSWPRNPD